MASAPCLSMMQGQTFLWHDLNTFLVWKQVETGPEKHAGQRASKQAAKRAQM